MAWSYLPILLEAGNSHFSSGFFDNVCFAVQVLDFSRVDSTLVFYVPLVDFTEKYIPWRKNIEGQKDFLVFVDCVCIHICLHQSARSESSPEDPDILRCHVLRKCITVKFMDCWNLEQPA